MTGQCIRAALDGDRCPLPALDGMRVCLVHNDGPAPDVERPLSRMELRAKRRELEETTRQLIERLAPLVTPEALARQRAEEKQARKDAWHARRREQEAQRCADAAEARKAAQEAAQDPATRQACRVCGRSLPLEAFPRDRAALLGRMTRCRDCQRAYDRERRSKR